MGNAATAKKGDTAESVNLDAKAWPLNEGRPPGPFPSPPKRFVKVDLSKPFGAIPPPNPPNGFPYSISSDMPKTQSEVSKRLNERESEDPSKASKKLNPPSRDIFQSEPSSVLLVDAQFRDILEELKRDFEEKWKSRQESNAKMEDFDRIKTLGTGSFGRVMLVMHKPTKNYYAMKILDKQKSYSACLIGSLTPNIP
ncbi:unnamed protein product [Cyprideis torosa]|uniref:cAMP-dependent protein kinase n=1 Tax=Cyprideis torosa TaxID=163714 RepID=A0A7R8WI63_9CRUS|nr:unnamed protein product [Cyprideis torosa]CAG0894343.1 unnamed protein product [Cyprideis torosa]